MRVKIKWVGNKEKFFQDIVKVMDDDGKYLWIDHVEKVEIVGK